MERKGFFVCLFFSTSFFKRELRLQSHPKSLTSRHVDGHLSWAAFQKVTYLVQQQAADTQISMAMWISEALNTTCILTKSQAANNRGKPFNLPFSKVLSCSHCKLSLPSCWAGFVS